MNSLFIMTDPAPEVDPVYAAIRDGERSRDIREWLDQQWSWFHEYADSDFTSRFWRKSQFQSCVWEIRLGWALRQAGLTFTSADAGPDFSVTSPAIHVEAIAPDASEPIVTALRDMRLGEFVDMPDEEIILRFTGAIEAKRKQHARWLQHGRVATSDPFVVAVSGSKFGPGVLDPEQLLILYPLFGLKGMIARFLPETVAPSIEWQAAARRAKASGASVDNFLFGPVRQHVQGGGLGTAATEVSAIIFSDSNFRHHPSSLDDLVLIHNPAAPHPAPEGFLSLGREYARRGDQIVQIADYRTRGRS